MVFFTDGPINENVVVGQMFAKCSHFKVISIGNVLLSVNNGDGALSRTVFIRESARKTGIMSQRDADYIVDRYAFLHEHEGALDDRCPIICFPDVFEIGRVAVMNAGAVSVDKHNAKLIIRTFNALWGE